MPSAGRLLTPWRKSTRVVALISPTTPAVEAIGTVLSGATWQRCRIHTMRNVPAHVPQHDKPMVAAALKMIFAQPNQAAAKAQLREVVKTLHGRWLKVAETLKTAADDLLTYMAFPTEHWSRLDSTNPLERHNREVKRHTDVVDVFPDDPAQVWEHDTRGALMWRCAKWCHARSGSKRSRYTERSQGVS